MPKKDASYNGWPNYETWNVMLWMDNDEPSYRFYRDWYLRMKDRGQRFTGVDAKWCCEYCLNTSTPDGIYLSNSRIRWGAIAKAMRAED